MISLDDSSPTPHIDKRTIQYVLLVEDSPTQALNLKATLQAEGLTVNVVNDGPEAIELAQEQPVDLIVLDIDLPTLNGFDTCRRLKIGPATAHIPVILFTHRDRPVDTLTGLDLGAIDYIPKDGFAQPTLVKAIRQLNKGDF